jgi:predicted HNH restriction endonuclease
VIRAVNLSGMREGTLIWERLGKLRAGMTVGDALQIKARRPLTKYDIRCAIDNFRIALVPTSTKDESSPSSSESSAIDNDEILKGFREGVERQRFIRHRSREANLRSLKLKDSRRRNGGRLICEVPNCGFDFAERYGPLGEGYAEVHHKEQLSEAPKEGRMDAIEDLAVACANCHAMINIGGECRPLEDLIPRRPE